MIVEAIKHAAAINAQWIVTLRSLLCADWSLPTSSALIGSSRNPIWMQQVYKLMRTLKRTVFLGCPEREGRRFYNSVFVIGPTGEILGKHRKINELSDSLSWSSPGDSAAPIDCDGIKVGVLICSDAYTSNIARALKFEGAVMLVSPASWGPGIHGPNGEWEQRSQETGLPVIGAVVVPGADDPESQLQLLTHRDGSAACIVCAIPFIRPRDVLQSRAGQSADDKQLGLQQAIAAHYQSVYTQALARCEALRSETGITLPIIATGHLATVGATSSESVRELYVGSLDAFPANAFPPADYIALGHIHRPQQVGGLAHIRYSGSPLPLSFDEARQAKEMLLVDLTADGLQGITALPVPCFQALVAIEATLAGLPAAIGAAAAQALPGKSVWLEITINEDDYLADLPARVQAVCEGWPVEVLRIRKARSKTAAVNAEKPGEMLDELTLDEVFARRLAPETPDAEVHAALNERRQIVAGLTEEDA